MRKKDKSKRKKSAKKERGLGIFSGHCRAQAYGLHFGRRFHKLHFRQIFIRTSLIWENCLSMIMKILQILEINSIYISS